MDFFYEIKNYKLIISKTKRLSGLWGADTGVLRSVGINPPCKNSDDAYDSFCISPCEFLRKKTLSMLFNSL